MGRWKIDDDGNVLDENGCFAPLKLLLPQIVRDHNAMPGLVEIAKKWRVYTLSERDKGGSGAYGWMCEADIVDEVLAQVEGENNE